MIATAGGREQERERQRAGEHPQFYLGNCGKVPSCFMLTGHLSNWNDATALSLLHHVAQLWLPDIFVVGKIGSNIWKHMIQQIDLMHPFTCDVN